MATEAASQPPSAPGRCQEAAPTGPCPGEERMDVPREREAGAPEPAGPAGQDEAPAAGQSPATSGEEGSRSDGHDACPAPPAEPGPAGASDQPACRGEVSPGDLLGDPPGAAPSLDAVCHVAHGEPPLSAEQGCQESAQAAGVETGDESPAASSGAEQPAEEPANDPQPAGEQARPAPGSAGAQGGQDASRPPGPEAGPEPGRPSPAPGDLAACSQQRAAGARPAAAVPRSPVATGDSCGPAHLACDSRRAPGGGEGRREGPAGSSAGGAGKNNKSRGEVGAGAVQESEPREVPPGDARPQGTSLGGDGAGETDSARQTDGTGEPGGARETDCTGETDGTGEPGGARETDGTGETDSTRETDSTGEPGGAEDPGRPTGPAGADDPADIKAPTGAEAAAGPEAPAGTRDLGSAADPAGSRDPAAADHPTGAGHPAGTADRAGEEPAGTSNLGRATDPAVAGDPAGARDPGAALERKGETMENGELSPAAPLGAPKAGGETPIEREIRVHQEREETLRRQRGLASPRVATEYVEVRMKPILSQAQPPAPLPKGKERQWAGAQMQREIQRETRREDDLVQQGMVRGAYDRGTPQELQEKKMLFEQQPSPESPSPRKPVRVTQGNSSETPLAQGPRGPTFTEANCRANVVIQGPSSLLSPGPGRQPPSAQGNPFFSLRPRSPQSRLEQELLEAQERERELHRQRHSLYGWTLPWDAQGAADGMETPSSRPERPSCGKLDVTWPPPALVESPQQNGLDQVERRPRSPRQKSALIQRWESGAVCNQESQE